MPPWLALLLLVSLILALAYQLTTRRFGWRVVIYWAVIFAALMVFEGLAESLSFNATRLGDVRLAPDLAGGVTALLGLWLLGV